MSDSKTPPPVASTATTTAAATTGTRRSDFALEPNPFEKSFSAPSSNLRTSKPESPRTSPKPTLPPLASLASPGGYSWSFDSNSLRTGPLSPAMLAGPRPDHMQWDPSNFRTGLTPRSGFTPRTGLTPGTGLTPLVNGGQGPFAPPTPNTAAFIAMIDQNSTSAMTPNTLNAITGTMNNSAQPYAPHQPSSLHNTQSAEGNDYMGANEATNSAANGLFLLSQAHQELTKREEAEARAANGNGNGRRGAAGRMSDASNDPPATLPPPAPTRRGGRATASRTAAASAETAPPKRGTKRKNASEAAASAPAPKPKKTRANGGRARKNSTPASDEDDMADFPDPGRNGMDGSTNGGNGSMNGDEDDDEPHNPNKKPETEEEKRKNFLERNRQAALKCRQRKKAWLSQLQTRVEQLTQENEKLTAALVSSREEISRLSAMVGSAGINGVGMPVASVAPVPVAPSQPVSMPVSMKTGTTTTAVVPTAAIVVRPPSSGTGANAGVPVVTAATGYGY